MTTSKQMTIGETLITVQDGKDDDDNPIVFLMIENEDGEINLDLSATDARALIELIATARG